MIRQRERAKEGEKRKESGRRYFEVSPCSDCNFIKGKHKSEGGGGSGMVRVCADTTACCCFVRVSDIRRSWSTVCERVRECACVKERENTGQHSDTNR